jgi:hypothetical protein
MIRLGIAMVRLVDTLSRTMLMIKSRQDTMAREESANLEGCLGMRRIRDVRMDRRVFASGKTLSYGSNI